jgi:hypothetical protein
MRFKVEDDKAVREVESRLLGAKPVAVLMDELATAIDEALNGPGTPAEAKQNGFALVVFKFREDRTDRVGGVNYVANCDRAGMRDMLKGLVERLEQEDHAGIRAEKFKKRQEAQAEERRFRENQNREHNGRKH